ncbi:MAG: ATP-binding protein [Candidatus Scalindua sp.]|nr:ATP-binding protein [Candidatus Scalindua sp.]
MPDMIKRWITNKLEKSMQYAPAVALIGPRQVGKTTLAQMVAKSRSALYLDLENPEDLLKLSDPSAFLSLHADKLVIVDEIQRTPDLFMVLRGLIDKNRRAGRKSEQYLLLGSASIDLLRQSSESLAGRISYIEMSGLNILEVPADKPEDVQRIWLRGGFPESYLAKSDSISMDWLENLIRTYLERDVPQMGFRVSAVRLRRLWTMLAHLQGEGINFSKLACNMEVDGKTVASYVDILVDLLLVRRLEPWHANVKKRLVKSPHFYIRDSGILHRLLGIGDYDSLLSNPVLGKSWEGFVIENILSVLPRRAEAYFYRTAAGAEIDLLLKLSSKDLWAIEVKNSVVPKIRKGFYVACEDVKASHRYVVYGGTDEFPIGKETVVISLKNIMMKLQDTNNDYS